MPSGINIIQLPETTEAGPSSSIVIADAEGRTLRITTGNLSTGFTFEIEAVQGLQAALDAKAALSHTHAIESVIGLQAALDAKAALTHSHAISDVTNLQTTLDGKAASSHTHTIANVTGLQAALDAKGSGTVTSVAFSSNASFLTVTGSPVTGSGTLTANLTTGLTANRVLATPNGSSGTVGLRALVADDLPSISASKLLTGTMSGDFAVNGSVSVTNNLTIGSGGSALTKMESATFSHMFGGLTSGNEEMTTVSFPGVTPGAALILNHDATESGVIFDAWCNANDLVTIRATNVSPSFITPASQSFRITHLKF